MKISLRILKRLPNRKLKNFCDTNFYQLPSALYYSVFYKVFTSEPPPVPEVGSPAVREGHLVVLDDGAGKGPGLHPHQLHHYPVKLVIALRWMMRQDQKMDLTLSWNFLYGKYLCENVNISLTILYCKSET